MNAPRRFSLSGLFAIVIAASACGSSASTSVAPSPVARCDITLNASTTTVPAGGGSGTATVGATRECAWSASVEGGNWLSIRSGASGQGDGTVEFAAASNPDPQARTGALVVNGSKTAITQSAAECVITLATSSANFPQAGGNERIDVQASSALCAWTASSDASWISITSGTSGRGSGPVMISVAATTGPPRTGSLTIGGQQFSVTQSQGCAYAIDRTSHAAAGSGDAGAIVVTTAPACPWTATANVNWITVTPAAGTGPGAVAFTVAPAAGVQRTGTAVIAGQLFTITQAPGCSYQVNPSTHSAPAAGGSGSVSVATASGCPWTATSNVPWITLQSPSSSTGPGTVAFTVAPAAGADRAGTLTIAGQPVTVTQTQGCSFSISPQSASVAASGGTGTVSVTAGSECSWTATSSVPWITITSGATGAGNGEVQFTVAATNGGLRSATLTIAAQTFTLTQGGGCTYGLSADRYQMPAGGGDATVAVTSDAACAWTATSNASWLTITSGAGGSGNGTVGFNAAPNTGPARTGTLTIADRTVSVEQAGSCTYQVAPETIAAPGAGTTARVEVTAATGCAWTATSNASWVTVTAGTAGSGDGHVDLSVAPNTGNPTRTGTVTIAGRTVTVSQEPACDVTLTPTSQDVPASGGGGNITVEVRGKCGWTAVSSVPWIVVTAGGSGEFDGVVQFTVAANTSGAPRSGAIVISGAMFTVNQQ